MTRYKDGTSTTVQDPQPPAQSDKRILGAYTPDGLHLENMNGSLQTLVISEFLEKDLLSIFCNG
jgi:hypothetical protein